MSIRILFLFMITVLQSACNPEPPEWMTDPGEIIFQGYRSVDSNCSRCHGRDGRGGMDGENIRGALNELGANEVFDIIKFGKGDKVNGMPPLGEELNDADIHNVINYMRKWDIGDSTVTIPNSVPGLDTTRNDSNF
ncbi:cytochrome c [candidate division KSB1 bacterium]|nr:cytochrome c [candidate division KSB1 bacterium]